MLAHLKHRVLLAALFAVGLTLAACSAVEPNDSNDQASPERKLMPIKAKRDMKAMRQFQVRGAQKAAPELRARLQLQGLRAR